MMIMQQSSKASDRALVVYFALVKLANGDQPSLDQVWAYVEEGA